MNRLRHPVRAIREPFGTAGLIVACVAIVLALTGAAFAAGGLNGKQKKEVEKIAKKVAGKPGAPGAPGAQGPAGPAGASGSSGANGKNGTNGKSVVVGAEPKGEHCEEGGSSLELEGSGLKHYACNGSPWTAGGTLPSGRTETGGWLTEIQPGKTGVALISFSLPLSEALAFHSQAEEEAEEGVNQVHFILLNGKEVREEVEEEQTSCPGSAAEPKATAGNLCVYLGYRSSTAFVPLTFRKLSAAALGADTAGAFYVIENQNAGETIVSGTWAVTAP